MPGSSEVFRNKMFRIWWIKRWRARRAGMRDAEWALGLMRGHEPSPFIEELLAEWEHERSRRMATFYDDQQRGAGRAVRIPVIAGAAAGVTDADERRRTLASAGAREKARLESEAFRHRLMGFWSPFARVIACYKAGFYRGFPADADIPPELMRATGVPDDFADPSQGTAIPALPAGPANPLGFAPSGKKKEDADDA